MQPCRVNRIAPKAYSVVAAAAVARI